jgi:hypothetical protein
MFTRREVRRAVYDMEWTMWKRHSRLMAIRKLFRLAWWERFRSWDLGHYGDA